MNDCRLKPGPSGEVKIVAAGQSPTGINFAAEHTDYNFVLASGVNTPAAHIAINQQLVDAIKKPGRDVGAYVLFMVIADETDEAAFAKWQSYKDGIDVGAVAWMADQGSKDKTASSSSTAVTISLPEQAVNFNMGTLVGSYANVARLLDQAAGVPGTKGLMLTFDDFVAGIELFGRRIQPLMKTRADRLMAVA